MTFEELGIVPNIVRAIQELGFEQPMPVQEKVIPLLLAEETDIVALAQTGTGKTAAFGLPLIQQISPKNKNVQALVLCPTRELCMQIADDLSDYSKYIDSFKILPVYGGSSIEMQINALRKGVQIVVATPGRLIDLIDRKVIKLDHVKKVVLDEADEMLNMGFSESIKEIFENLPEEKNTLLFSATMPKEIATIAKKYMNKPKEVTIGQRNSGAENIKHICYTVHARDKYLTLKRIADFYPNIYGIVFCRTRRETQEVADKLIKDGYSAESLHGDLSQAQRDFVMQKFRIRNIRLLVATDVAARGIDVNDLTHIINYDLPDDIEVYTHRSGRTGRAGKTGISIVISNLREKHSIKQIEKKINKEFTFVKVPTGREVCEKQLFHLIDKLEKVEIDHTEIEPYLPMVYKKLSWVDKEDLIKRLVSLEFNRFLEYYRKAKDISQDEGYESRDNRRGDRRDDRRDRDGGGRRDERRSDRTSRGESDGSRRRDHNNRTAGGFTRMFINIGKMDGAYANTIIELINRNTPGPKIILGKIDLLPKFSFFEVEEGQAGHLVKSFKNVIFEDKKVNIEVTKDDSRKSRRRD